MLISHVAMRVTQMPFKNMQELYDSDYKFLAPPGTSNWDAFKNGDALWQTIFKAKLEPFEEDYKLQNLNDKMNHVEWLLSDDKNAAYINYFFAR